MFKFNQIIRIMPITKDDIAKDIVTNINTIDIDNVRQLFNIKNWNYPLCFLSIHFKFFVFVISPV